MKCTLIRNRYPVVKSKIRFMNNVVSMCGSTAPRSKKRAIDHIVSMYAYRLVPVKYGYPYGSPCRTAVLLKKVKALRSL